VLVVSIIRKDQSTARSAERDRDART
jgi:hypothetical protein